MNFLGVNKYLIVVLFLALVGCNDNIETTTGSESSPASEEPSSSSAPSEPNNNPEPNTTTDTTPEETNVPSDNTPRNCTPAEVAGQWRVTLMALGTSQTEVVTIQESDVLGNNTFTLTDGDITLNGTIDSSCRRMSGTATQGSINGTWFAVKL